jgi:predicted nucleic acid-binding protein
LTPLDARRRPIRRTPRALAPVVVDASIAVQWFAPEPGSEEATRLLDGERPLSAPDIMPVEASNAWWKKVRRREMSKEHLDEAVLNLLSLDIRWMPSVTLLRRAAGLSVEIDHPVYDCLYLLLATEQRGDLATADMRLRRAARRLDLRLWPVARG